MTFNLNGNHWANSDNMGKKLLVKAGWSSGEGVGKDKQGTNVHIKVSIKNEKQGIGMKADKRQSGANLMQCFQFDHLLKTKYGKTTESVVTPASERSMSRSRFGRAVPRDFFDPVDKNQWNRILCSSESAKTDQCKTEPSVKEISKFDRIDNNANFTSSKTIYEYFSSKMSGSNGTSGIGSLQEFLRARDNERDPEVNKPAYDHNISNESEEVPKKKSKSKITNKETTDPVVISIEIEVGGDQRKSKKQKKQTQDVEKVVEIEGGERVKKSTKESKQGKIQEDIMMVVEENTDVKIEKTRKRKTTHKEDDAENKKKRKKYDSQVDDAVKEVKIEINEKRDKKKTIKEHQKDQKSDFKNEDKSNMEDSAENDREGRKSSKKKEDFENVTKIEKTKNKKQKNQISCHEEESVQEKSNQKETKLEFEIQAVKSAPRESQKKRKSKNVDNSTVHDNDVGKNVENTDKKLKASDNILTTQRMPSESKFCPERQSVVAELTELVETPFIDPWTTSSIHTIPGYRYY